MRPFFGRVGGKSRLKKKLLKLIPQHSSYVEPFVGGGSMYWALEPTNKDVINDIDKDLIKGYKLLKSCNTDPKAYVIPNNTKQMQTFVDSKLYNRNEDKLLKLLYMSTNTFGNIGKGKIYKNISGKSKINSLADYKERMKKTTILNTDYKTVIKNYDSNTTFFFIDPPYEHSDTLYENSNMNYNDLRDILINVKGYFMLTINDSKVIRDTFKMFTIKGITVKSNGNAGIGDADRKELIIMNYKL